MVFSVILLIILILFNGIFSSRNRLRSGDKYASANNGIVISFAFLTTVAVVSTNSFNFSAALLERNTSINSKNVLIKIKAAITIIFAGLGFCGRIISV